MRLLQITTAVTNDITELLHASVIGTPGSGMLYQHKSIERRIRDIKVPFFVELRTKLGLVGTCCFCFRETLNRNRTYQSFYIRYFSFKENFRAKRTPQPRPRAGKLRQEINTLLDGEHFESVSTDKYFHYAYVDPRNTRSVLLCQEFGFQYVRRFTTFVFSRLNPKVESGITVSQVNQEEISELRRLLLNRYSDFNMVSFDGLFVNDPYYVAKDSTGRIIAGAQVSPTHWRIYKMHNKANTMLLSILSHVPFLNRLVNKEFRFLALDGLYFTEGYEHYTEALLCFLLRKHNHFNVFMPSDDDSSLFRHLEKLNHGIVSKISKQVSTTVICRFHNFSTTEIEQFKQYPAYVSALDIT
jgi:hypothetical protein